MRGEDATRRLDSRRPALGETSLSKDGRARRRHTAKAAFRHSRRVAISCRPGCAWPTRSEGRGARGAGRSSDRVRRGRRRRKGEIRNSAITSANLFGRVTCNNLAAKLAYNLNDALARKPRPNSMLGVGRWALGVGCWVLGARMHAEILRTKRKDATSSLFRRYIAI